MSIIMGWYVLNWIWILKERKIETNPKKAISRWSYKFRQNFEKIYSTNKVEKDIFCIKSIKTSINVVYIITIWKKTLQQTHQEAVYLMYRLKIGKPPLNKFVLFLSINFLQMQLDQTPTFFYSFISLLSFHLCVTFFSPPKRIRNLAAKSLVLKACLRHLLRQRLFLPRVLQLPICVVERWLGRTGPVIAVVLVAAAAATTVTVPVPRSLLRAVELTVIINRW